MLQCTECGEFGTIDKPSKEEWCRAFDAPTHPYVWKDESRITLRPEHRPPSDYWQAHMGPDPENN
jgi:hypothetical protein